VRTKPQRPRRLRLPSYLLIENVSQPQLTLPEDLARETFPM
jgi:hypothetical protein